MKDNLFKKDIKHIVIFYRSNNSKIKKKIQEVCVFLKKHKLTFELISQEENIFFKKTDLVLCLGGDGTYLKAVKYGKGSPILGVNMGSLGFLTPYEAQKTLFLLEKTLAGKMFLKKSNFLKSSLYDIDSSSAKKYKTQDSDFCDIKSHKAKKIFYSVNDIVIERGSLNHLIHLSIFINKEYIYSLKSDGLIISSPIGSTAYNLAAGGPILHPKVSSFVITPVCSHSLTNRPVVIPDSSVIYLKFENNPAYLTIDGLTQTDLSHNNILLIQKDTHTFSSVIEKEETEFALLRKKLKFGQRD